MIKTIINVALIATFFTTNAFSYKGDWVSSDSITGYELQDFKQNDMNYFKSKTNNVLLNVAKSSFKVSKNINISNICANKPEVNFSNNNNDFAKILKESRIDTIDKKNIVEYEVILPACSEYISKMSSNISRTLDTVGGYKLSINGDTYCKSFLVNKFRLQADLFDLNLFFSSLLDIKDKDIAFASLNNLVSVVGYKLYSDPVYFMKFAQDNNLFSKPAFNEFFELVANGDSVTEFLETHNENLEKPTDFCFMQKFKEKFAEREDLNDFLKKYSEVVYMLDTDTRECLIFEDMVTEVVKADSKEDYLSLMTEFSETRKISDYFDYEIKIFRETLGFLLILQDKKVENRILFLFKDKRDCEKIANRKI